MFTDKSFGYETACAALVEAIKAAHAEALTVRNGVGLVKLMGRHSRFIACSAALATSEVNFVLIPEVPFTLEGDNGFLEALERCIQQRGYALIVVAEGAGQDPVSHARLWILPPASQTSHCRVFSAPVQFASLPVPFFKNFAESLGFCHE